MAGVLRRGGSGHDEVRAAGLRHAPDHAADPLRASQGKGVRALVSSFARFPLLSDGKGEVLTFPPVINSALIGGVKPGDTRLFVDLTGPDLDIILTACAIAACDFADMGFTILPVTVEYPWDTPWGRTIVTPFYFQKDTVLDVAEASKRLG